MLRERTNSKFISDPRVDWIPGNDPRARDHCEGGVFICEILAVDLPAEAPERSDFLWDFQIYSDETVRVGTADGGSQCNLYGSFLVANDGRQKALTGYGGYATLDRMLELLLGQPID